MNTPAPTKTKRYTKSVLITFTPTQKKMIEEMAKEKGLSMASFIRSRTLEAVEKDLELGDSKHKLAKFAGVLNSKQSQEMLQNIYEMRSNKD